jgi:regulator of protease activity HflC (stomatin/prohibitin superfamily)
VKKIILLAATALSLAACSRVTPGHVGVKVNNYGSNAGVEDKALGIGTYWTGFGSDISEYPVYTNNYVWANGTKCTGEGDDKKCDGANEELPFQDKNGLVVAADVNVAYHVNPALAPKLYQTYRADMEGIVAGPMRNRVRSALVTAASTMTVEEIYGPKKAVLIAKATQIVRSYFEPLGLHIDALDWAGPIRIPENIMERINARAQTEQAAIAAQAQVATEEAKGRAAVAKATAEANAKIEDARGDAESIRIRNAAVVANPGYQSEWVRKWDGQLPKTVYCTSENPCVSVPEN